jgi:hypothetical protein
MHRPPDPIGGFGSVGASQSGWLVTFPILLLGRWASSVLNIASSGTWFHLLARGDMGPALQIVGACHTYPRQHMAKTTPTAPLSNQHTHSVALEDLGKTKRGALD